MKYTSVPGFAIALVALCWNPVLAQDHNIGYYQKISEDGQQTTWSLVWSDHFPEVVDEQVQAGDIVVSWGGPGDESSCSSGPLPGNEFCMRSMDKPSSIRSNGADPAKLPDIVVTASPPSRPSYMLAIIPYRGSGGGGCRDAAGTRCGSSIPIGDAIIRPPGVIKECNPEDEDLDKTSELREQLMDQSLADEDLAIEYGGLFWPDGEGGYDLLEYGVDIPGGGSGPCSMRAPPAEAFPPAEEWPSGVIFFHTHPYAPGDFVPACDRTIRAGPSPGDRAHLEGLRNTFNADVEGMVEDKMAVYRYGAEVDEDQPPTQRCR